MTWMMVVMYSLLTSSTAISLLRSSRWHHQSKIIGHVGATVILNCSTLLNQRSNSTFSPTIKWYKFGQPFGDVSYRSMATVFVNGSHVLRLDNLLLADSGMYECEGDGSTGTRSGKKTFHLSIKENKPHLPPAIVKEKLLHKSTRAGQTVQLECQGRSGAMPYFQWFYYKTINVTNDKAIEKGNILTKPRQVTAVLNSEINGTRLHQDLLLIHNVSNLDTGLYVCMVFNKNGKDFRRIRLHVFAVPSESSTELEVKHITKPDNVNSLGSKIPMIILIALPAGLFILSCTAVIRSLERTRQARLARKRQQNNPTHSRDENDHDNNTDINAERNSLHTVPSLDLHTNYKICNHIQYASRTIETIETIRQNYNGQQLDDSDVDSTSSSAPGPEAYETSSPLDVLSNLSRQSSSHMTSTEAPFTTSTPPPELSSTSVGLELDLEWEGLDLVLPEGCEFVQISKEVDV